MHESIVPVDADFTLLKRHLSAIRRRVAVRYRCELATFGKLASPTTGLAEDIWVHDLSETGIGVNLSHALEVGLDVIIRLKENNGKAILEERAKVIHATKEVDGTWRIGCQFEKPLAPGRLDAFL